MLKIFGIQILYDMFNQFEDTWCERVYSPWPDLDAIMREEKIPLFALESQDPVKDFDVSVVDYKNLDFDMEFVFDKFIKGDKGDQ